MSFHRVSRCRRTRSIEGPLDELIEMSRTRRTIDLVERPSRSAVCKAFERFDMATWCVLLFLSETMVMPIRTSGHSPTDSESTRSFNYREFTPLEKAWNAWIDADFYEQPSRSELPNSTLEPKYGASEWSRRWRKQFRKLTTACATHGIDRSHRTGNSGAWYATLPRE